MKLYNLASAGFFIAKNPGGKMALSLLASNNAQTVLAAGINSTATSLTVNAGTGTLFPSPVAGISFFKLTIIDAATGSLTEIVHVTARAGDVFTIQRGQEGTVPRAWSANDIAANMMTAGTLSYILGNFQPLDPTLTALAALVGVANKLPYFNGDDTAALTDITQVGRDIIGKSTITDIRTYLNLSSFISSPSTGPGDFTQVNSPDGKRYLFIANNNQWGAQTEDGKAIPLTVERGGSGSGTPEGARAAFGLGDSATKNVGTTAGTVAAGDDSRLVNLKSAANRSVGNSANQIPDMSYFTTGETSAGRWAKLPSGLIIQAGFGLTGSAGTATVNLPIPFTGTFYVVGGSIEGNGPIFVSARGLTQSTIGVVAWGRDGSIQVTNMHWLAIGV
ncbi:gp53-like domain-containing protein [Citrobacter freundii]|nr:hypothetical protein [Citrobacter freundii]